MSSCNSPCHREQAAFFSREHAAWTGETSSLVVGLLLGFFRTMVLAIDQAVSEPEDAITALAQYLEISSK
jgi:hypothetical protein